MAVEIPVVIDIDKAFQEAASKVPKAVKPLQEYLNANALRIKVDIGDGKKVAVKQVFEDAKISANELKTAIADVEARIAQLAMKGGFDLTKGLTAQEKNLMTVYGALEAKVNKTADGSRLIGKLYSVNIQKARVKVWQLTNDIEKLTIKQNQAYRKVNGSFVPTEQFDVLSAKIQAANAELTKTRTALNTLSVEFDKVSGAGTRAAASMGAMGSAGRQMVAAWERGAIYMEKYNASLGVANSRVLTLLKSFTSLFALHAALSFVRNIREVTSEFEMQRVALGGIIQDTEEAERLFKRIKAAAIQSPFEIKDLVSFTKQLSAYRIETENLFDVTMKLADVSAGLGVDMSRLVLAYGQVRAASVLRGQELRQFTEAGIPLVELLADKFSLLNHRMVSTGEVFELISKRAVPFRMIEEIFDDMTSAGGIFYKMQEKQSETLKGQWMKLKDALSIMYDEIGNTKVVHGAMETLLKDAMHLFQNWQEVAKNVKVVVAAMIAYKVAVINAKVAQNALTAAEVAEISALQLNVVGRSRLIAALAGESAATKVQIVLGNAYVAVKKREMIATNLFSRALYRMTAALLANPYALAIAGIAALVAILIKYTKKSKEAVVTTDQLQKSIGAFDKARSHAKDIDDLCNAYDRLSSKANRTKEEEERLSRVTKDLAKSYPDAIQGANEHTKAIEIDTKAIRERNAAVKEAIRLTLVEDKKSAEERVSELEGQYNRIADILSRGTIEKGAYGTTWFEPITDDQRRKFGERLIELEEEIGKYQESLDAANTSLEEFEEGLVGPPLPDFFGDAWRTKMNSYSVTLSETGEKTSAFTKDQIENFATVEDAVEEAIKEYDKITKTVEFYTHAIETATGAEKEQLLSLLTDAQGLQAMYSQIITDYNAWSLQQKKDRGSSYTQDPFIAQMQERMKFMQDFKKGYDDLNKYMDKSKAVEKEGDIMLTRGLSLGIDAEQQKRAAEGLSEWYDNAIQTAFKEAQKHGAKGSILDFLSQQINDSSNRGKALKDFQKLIQSLWDAKTDIDTSTLKNEIEDALKKLEDEVKRSETAHNFFQNILDLTGDQDLAATMTMSVYGDVGKDFKGRVQDQLDAALNSLDWGAMDDATFGNLSMATITQDFQTILEYIDLFPEEWQKVLRQMASDTEKNNADWYTDFIKTFRKAKTYEERINTLEQQKQQKLNEMGEKAGITDADRAAVKAYYAKEIAGVQLEAMKDTYTWTKAFEDLEGVSSQTLNNLISLIDEYVEKYGKDLEPQQLKELARSRENAKQQLLSRNAYKATSNAIRDLISASKRYTDLRAEGKENTEEGAKAADDYEEALKRLSDSLNQVYSDMDDVVSKTKDLMSVFASDEDSSYFSEQLDNITKTVKGAGTAAVGIGRMLLGDISPQAIMQTLTGLADVVTGIFGGVNAKQVRDANKEYEKQAKILQTLDRTYNKLEKSIGEAFGNDAVTRFTEQLKVLQAQQDAYLAQAANREEAAQKESTKKNKKRYEEEAEEAKTQAMEVGDAMASLRYEISSAFAGSDLSSAAESFADAWLEAYQEFGDTSTAIEERMTEMVQNIVKKAALSGIAQSVLGNWYDSLADVTDWNAQTIAEKWKEAMGLVGPMVEGMQVFANSMQAEGVSLRNTVGQFTGISRDIAGASEESINGLAAGINTQNFYMSFMPLIHENVAQILTYMTGGNTVTPATESGIEGMPSVQTLVNTHLPNIDANINSILQLLRSVISVGNVAPRNYVAAKM